MEGIIKFLLLNFDHGKVVALTESDSEHSLIYTDVIIRQLVYKNQHESLDALRTKVCRKLHQKIKQRGLTEADAGTLALRFESTLHRAYFHQKSHYRASIVWLVKQIQVSTA